MGQSGRDRGMAARHEGRGLAPLGSALLALAAAGALAALAACGPSRARMLEGEIAQAVQTSPGHVDLGRLYPAPWDRVCVLLPEITKARADSVLGFHYSAARHLVSRPDVAGLVFVRGKHVVVAVRYPRVDGDFTAAGRSYCLPRDRAIFIAVGPPTSSGGRKLLPAAMPAGGGRP